MRLILASRSPRRVELLGRLGMPFEAIPAEADERCEGAGPERVLAVAGRKAEAVLGATSGDCAVLGADTLVEARGEILGKPRDHEDARRMLRLLSDAWHEVHTGVVLLARRGGMFSRRQEAATSRVRFAPMGAGDIESCLAEAMDKAGAYGIQGRAGAYVERIEGDFYAIMGLPLCAVRRMVEDLTIETDA